jgi:hypothetical protein
VHIADSFRAILISADMSYMFRVKLLL